ncbi:TetR/AcrR family transcriptional regulator [Streptomyces sp. LP11]|uniref:TetR/AcrR family transcriptional regulator n=1 Tax=Streptomyces pyxinicus TaxID=2970331 RepID=A0ABT2B3N8_9ACTN|nr:TetR/AcrR family transcriptional regulator [Streptomyces sp. LP11]MCS0603132.1 TetR/AcrR family transcriptional regulator [Streptomyces sp. LP11]
MGRWQPNARGRLAEAALELYGERGYEQTTVAEIAKRAGLTERTFFRHYADKREVLFSGAVDLEGLFARAVAEAPESAAPLDAVACGFGPVSEMFADRRDFARRRQAVIMAHDNLRERELIKLAALSGAIAEALRIRRVGEPAASLAAEAGVAVFKVGFERWIAESERRGMAEILRESLAELRSVAASG